MPRRKPCLDSLTPIPRTEKPAEAPKPFEWHDETAPMGIADCGSGIVRLYADGTLWLSLTTDEAYRIGNALIQCARLARKPNATP